MSDPLAFSVGTAFELLGSPDETILQADEITGAVMRSLRLRRHQIGAVGSLLTGTFFSFTPQSRQFAVTEEGFSGAVYVDRLIDSVNEIYEPIQIADVPNLDELENEGVYAIAFYGSPDWQARISWDPGLEQFNDLRIWHDPQAIEPATLDTDLGVAIKIVPLILAHDAVLELLPRCALRGAGSGYTAQIIRTFQETSLAARAELLTEFDIWRFESEDDSGVSQSARFDADRHPARRLRAFRA